MNLNLLLFAQNSIIYIEGDKVSDSSSMTVFLSFRVPASFLYLLTYMYIYVDVSSFSQLSKIPSPLLGVFATRRYRIHGFARARVALHKSIR